MKFIKKNKILVIFITVFALVMIFAVIGIVKLLMPNGGTSVYGDRLSGIENVQIKDTTIGIIKESILDTGKVESIDYDLRGKLMNFIIIVKDTTDKVTATALTDKILSNLSEDEKKFYDIQVFVNTKAESEIYPIIGYKHTTSLNFSWSNNK